MGIKRAVVTGALGFAGWHLSSLLLAEGLEVIAVLRPDSAHNERLGILQDRFPGAVIEAVYAQRDKKSLSEYIGDMKADVFFDLAWGGERNDMDAQKENVDRCLDSLKTAAVMGCKRYIGVGSQAEYGVVDGVITEESPAVPFSAYGAAKLSACHLSRILSAQLGLEWIWGRIFSLTGKYEPAGRMMPDLVRKLREGEPFSLSSCRQNWDYLDAADCAQALFALAKRGRSGEIYNIANGAYRPLKEYVEEARDLFAPGRELSYGADPEPFVSLSPSVDKLKKDTGWQPEVTFEESIVQGALS